MISEVKMEYINSLTVGELRYECDKIHARLKEVERMKGMISELGEERFNPMLSVLDGDYELLHEEYRVYNQRYMSLRENGE